MITEINPTKASRRTMSIKARSNDKLFTFVPQLFFIKFAVLFALK